MKKAKQEPLGVQIYCQSHLTEDGLHLLSHAHLYMDEEWCKTAMDRYGVVFYRDSKHANGAIVCTDFKGKAYYYQFYVRDGKIEQVFVKDQEVVIDWIKDGMVKRTIVTGSMENERRPEGIDGGVRSEGEQRPISG